MNVAALALVAAACLTGFLAADSDVGLERVVMRADFEGDRALVGWEPLPQGARLAPGRKGSTALVVAREASAGRGSASVRFPLPLDAIRGRTVKVDGLVNASGVTDPPNAWNGVKLMLHIRSGTGDQWEQRNLPGGTWDWRRVRYRVSVPADASEATLILGLEEVTGMASFDDVSVSVPEARRPAPRGRPYRGHSLPRLRGAMIGTTVDADDLRVLAGWGANHVRWQLLWGGFPHGPADNGTVEAYLSWLDGEMRRLDTLLPVCRELGIMVVIDLHTPPGGRAADQSMPLFSRKEYQDAFVTAWERLSRRYRGNKAVWGYDLLNEPVEGDIGPGLMDWQELADHTARAVRAIDRDHAIILEGAPWGGPAALPLLTPIDVPGVVYSAHMYMPHRYTHQGIQGNPDGIRYPGVIEGQQWNKETIRAALKPVLDFQRANNCHIYIGEFSAIRWAPGAADYLRDLIEVMEGYGWDWAYHAFREWDGWSLEHGPDRTNHERSPEETDRLKVLRDWYRRSARPKG